MGVMVSPNAASVWRRFACEAERSGAPRKAERLKDACGALAHKWCISRTRVSCRFFACQRHTPREGFDVAAITRLS